MFTILVVCTGNVARSPLAQVLLARGLRQRLKDGADGLLVHSAGTLGLTGEPMTAPVRRLLADGADDPEEDLDAFRARRLEPELLAGADLVLGAGREHRSAAVGMAPHLVRRAFTLVELARLAGAAAHTVLTDWQADGQADGQGGRPLEPPPADRARAVVARASLLRATVRPLHVADDDIIDPHGRDAGVYAHVAARIGDAVETILDGLVGH